MHYTLSTETNDMDLDVIHQYISNSYWAKGAPREVIKRAVANSLCFGIFDPEGNQVAFARVISDKATFAYLADVFVLEQHRGKGLSKRLMEAVTRHPHLQGLRKFMLTTKDAHDLYAQYGFQAVEQPEMLMQIWDSDIYLNDESN